jgi:predicted phage terminase large subunit-like protein
VPRLKSSPADAPSPVLQTPGDVSASPSEPERRGATGVAPSPVESAAPALSGYDLAKFPLVELIPKLSPQFDTPYHLSEWCGIMDRAADGETLRAIDAEPIRHYKSRTTWHGVIKILLKDPTCPVIYLTHSHQKAQDTGKAIRDLAQSCDRQFGTNIGPNRGTNTIDHWSNDRGGGVLVMSAEMSRLGYDCGCLIADDPIDEYGALDPNVRESVDNTIAHYTARCMRKGKPGPVLIVASPWHPDDPMGRRRARTAREWLYVSHPAIIDDGLPTERAFAPKVWPLEELKLMRAELREKDPTERLWWAQLMCDPRPTGADLFGPATYWTKLPDWAFRRGFGVDLAYTVGEGADWFARVAGRTYGTKIYILDVTRHKIDAHLIESTCKADMNKYGRAPFFSYMAGPEVGMASVLNDRGVPISRMLARYNKLVRAQRTVKRWNDGDILVPEEGPDAPWVKGFLHRLSCFRGREGDTDDDEVDALVSLCDGIMGGAVGGVKTFGKAYPGIMGR